MRSIRDGEFVEALLSKGVLKDKKKGKTKEPNGTYVEFIPDTEIFKKFAFQKETSLKGCGIMLISIPALLYYSTARRSNPKTAFWTF